MIRAAMVMILRDIPAVCMQTIAAIIDMGMVLPTMREPLMSPKKINIMSMASITACSMVFATPFSESIISSAESSSTSIIRFGLFLIILSSSGLTSFERVTGETDCFLLIPTLTFSLPLYLESWVLSDRA